MIDVDLMIKFGGIKRQIDIAKQHAQEYLDHLQEIQEAFEHLGLEFIDNARKDKK